MKSKSKIEWTESTWNPVTGCTKISTGCQNCYAERMAFRLKAMGAKAYSQGFEVVLHPESLNLPLKTKKSKVIFVNSMSDLFHEDVPLDFILQIFDVMRQAHWHTFQILTKRSERLKKLDSKIDWPPNVWMGVTLETADYKYRINDLRQTGANIKFLSLEPLLSAIPEMNLDNIDWVIVGGESGPGARVMEKEWVLDIKEQCLTQEVPFFFKQWGGVNKKKNGRLLLNRTWDGLPAKVFEEKVVNA